MLSPWDLELTNGQTAREFLQANWRTLTDGEVAARLNDLCSYTFTRNAVKKQRQRYVGTKVSGEFFPAGADVAVPASSIPDPTTDAEPYGAESKFRETGANTGLLVHVREVCPDGAIKTVDQIIKESGIDLTVWRVGDKIRINKWPVGAKAEKKDIRWQDGRIVEGYVKSDGLTVAQLWQVEVPFFRIKPEPVFPIIQPVECSVRYEPPPLPQGGLKRAVIWTDPHFGYKRDLLTGELTPLHDDRTIDVVLQVAVAARADRVDLLGDIFDFAELTDRYLRLPEFKECLQPAVIAAHEWLSRFRQALPDAYMTAHEGNHDFRHTASVATNLRAAYELRAADELELPPALSVPRLLALHRLGIVWIDGYPQDVDWLNPDTCLYHGNTNRSGTGATARAILEAADYTEIVGHVHRIESGSHTIHRRGSKRVIQAHCLGCCCHIDGRVPGDDGKSQWQNGCAVVDYDPQGGTPQVTQVLIEEGRAIWNGMAFIAR